MPIIYSITTNFISGHKIGFWSGTPKKLRARYLTYYGPEIIISLFKCTDKNQEKKAHEDLEQYRVKGSRELYRGGTFESCEKYLKDKFGVPDYYDSTGFHESYSVCNLTQSYIMQVLEPIITKSLMQQGIETIISAIVLNLLQRDGKYIYYCDTRNGSRFMMLVNHNGEIVQEHDPESIKLRGIISAPLKKICLPIAMKHDEDAHIQDVFTEVKNLKNNSKLFNTTLRTILPSNSDGMSEGVRCVFDAGSEADAQIDKEILEWSKSQDKKKQIKLEEKARERADDILDGCESLSGGRYWHRTRHWIVGIDASKDFVILGYAGKREDKMVNLTKAQVQAVKLAGLGSHLDGQYI